MDEMIGELASKVDILDIERQDLIGKLENYHTELQSIEQLLLPVYERVKVYLGEFIQRIDDLAESPIQHILIVPSLNDFLEKFGNAPVEYSGEVNENSEDRKLLEKLPAFMDYMDQQDSTLLKACLEMQGRISQLEGVIVEDKNKLNTMNKDNQFLAGKIEALENRIISMGSKDDLVAKQKSQEVSLLQKQISHILLLNETFMRKNEKFGSQVGVSDKNTLFNELMMLVEQRYSFELERLRQ